MNEPSFGEMFKNKVITGQQLRCMYQTKWKKGIILKCYLFILQIIDLIYLYKSNSTNKKYRYKYINKK